MMLLTKRCNCSSTGNPYVCVVWLWKSYWWL